MASERRSHTEAPPDAQVWAALAQGAYYAATGLWPVLHLRSFEAVTGPKADRWLVKTVGLLAAVIGGTLLRAGVRGQVPPEVRTLALGSAAAFAAIDLNYVARNRISPVYLLDAAAEFGYIALWAMARREDIRRRAG